ncbi:hypothetical protein [Verminephrobacter aporrectodeae]|uniref:hypothetical protein n=1 Tax=Verminephrobacter aporrectodeae TaxID=1110389 RepID=UPI002243093F|nr:hypothetical protein [Verminephrobacter aporrectodeae]
MKRLTGKVNQDSGYRDFFARQYLGRMNEDGDRFRLTLEREHAFYADTIRKLGLGK